MEVTIRDKGTIREVEIKGRHYSNGGYKDESVFQTFYTRELLEKMLKIKQDYLKDEIDRAEDPDYIEKPFLEFLNHYSINLKDKKILDFGCGSGASSVILGKLGAEKVVGVDVNEELLSIAKLRSRDYGFDDKIEFKLLSKTEKLPFEDKVFEIVVCNGVIEHIYPRERRNWIKECWRVLAPEGNLMVLETPNKWWPKDTHTTGLWFINYLPLRMACTYARLLNNELRNDTVDILLSKGIKGATYWEIVSPLKGDDLIEMNRGLPQKVEEIFPLSASKNQRFLFRALKKGVRSGVRVANALVLKPLGLSFSAFAPYLRICLRKK